MRRVGRLATVTTILLVAASGAQAASLTGTSRSDRLEGTSRADAISGGNGADRILGRGGDDRLRGGNANDLVRGGEAADRVEGNRGADLLYGDSGNDSLLGGSGADRIYGGAGDDAIDAQDGVADRIDCGAGADTLVADPEDRVGSSCERAATPPSTEPGSRTGGWITCTEATTSHVEPGLTMFPQPVRLTISDTITNCMSSDPTIKSGTADVVVTSVAGSCLGGPIDGIAYVRWDNGKTTTLVFSGAFGGGGATARGAVIDGSAFVGRHFHAADLLRLHPSMLSACSSAEGLKTFAADGRITIGLPFAG